MTLRAFLACLGLINLAPVAFDATGAQAQSITPDLFRPVQGGFVSPQDLPLRTHPKVTPFPHIGSATHETRRAMAELATENLLRVLDGEELVDGAR